jgi:porphobilinogen synthase
MIRETRLHPSRFVLPVFVVEGEDIANPIASMPGNFQWSVDRLTELAKRAQDAGIGGMMFFGVPDDKDAIGSGAWNPAGPVPRAITAVAQAAPELVRWGDVCLCEYTDHGHCGPLAGETVDNDATLPLLAKASVTYVEAGADVIAPSDMMDGRVAAIRQALDEAGHPGIPICSYSAKYASGYYGPFRDAADSAPAFGDRSTYQMDPPNRREALREIAQDEAEGADMLMVKPAGPYLDVIAAVRASTNLPLAAYQVSGEFAMIEAAGANGWIDRDRVMMESLTGIARAGADIVLTYFAIDAAKRIT